MGLITFYIACVILSLVLGAEKNRPILGLTLGILFGFIGVIFIALFPRKEAV